MNYRNIPDEELKGSQKGYKNLIPLSERPEEERKALNRKGGINSGKKKRLAKDMRESMKILLEMPVSKEKLRETLGPDADLLINSGYDITWADLLNLKMMQQAGEGSAKHFEVSRDTAGFKPVEKVETDVNIMSEADKALLAKVAKRTGVDQKQ